MQSFKKLLTSRHGLAGCQGAFWSKAGALTWLALVVFFIAVSPAISNAQTCNALAPSGDTSGNTDWSNITSCLNTVNYATLQAGTFYISQPITMPAPFATLTGAGKASTILTPKYDCSQTGVITSNGQNITVNDTKVTGFKIDLASCGAGNANAVFFLRTKQDATPGTTGGEISNLKITGGGPNMIGVLVSKSFNVTVRNITANDVLTGIWVADSPSAQVDANDVHRDQIGIFIQNSAGVATMFDASNTSVTNNTIDSASTRAMKLQSSDAGGLPLRNLSVTGNTLTGFSNVGLYLVGNVQNSVISNNVVQGAPGNYALWIGSINPGQVNPGLNPSYNNTITANTFQVGMGSTGYDVSFNGSPTGNNIAGPDQPTISRGSAGSNTLGFRGIEPTPSSRCSQYAHAWFDYLNGLNYVPSGGQVLLSAAGTRQSSTVTYHIRPPGSSTDLLSFTHPGSTNSSCVLNQMNSPAITLAPGTYDVFVDLVDGNARYPNAQTGPGVPINNWKLGFQLKVQ